MADKYPDEDTDAQVRTCMRHRNLVVLEAIVAMPFSGRPAKGWQPLNIIRRHRRERR